METLKELVDLIHRNKGNAIDVIGYQQDGLVSKVNHFYQKIAAGELPSDEAAANYFFGTDASDIAYRKLKSKLKSRLINTVFFINVKQANYTEQERAYVTCWKEWAAAKILFGRGAAKLGADLAHRILKQSQFFEFTELSVSIIKALRTYYATRRLDLRKFEKFNILYREFARQLEAENLAEEYYLVLVAHYIHSRASKPELSRQAEEFYLDLEPLLTQFNSFRLHRYYYMIRVVSHMTRSDYRGTIAVCDEALSLLRTRAFYSPGSESNFLYQKLVCHTQLKEYREGRQVAEESLNLEVPGSYNWFKNRELGLILAMHTRNYQEAHSIFRQAVEHPDFRILDPISVENWKIYEAYLHYLQLIGRVVPEGATQPSSFRIGRFLNEVPVFSRDKRGMNIPILVIQILFSITQKQYDKAVQRIETIQKYCSRYLRHDDTFRSNCFIRMLLQIPKSKFHRSGVIRRAEPFRKQLEEVPLEVANQGHDIEIIPYEDLWEIALESLGTRFFQGTARRGNTEAHGERRRE